jgi:NADPH:quinone reductase-like Zn-dependent oxidoreductase
VCVPENANALALKPVSMTFEEIAAIPQAAVLALQGLRKGQIQPGNIDRVQKVLINGASGGVGSFAVQMAKSFGAEVTGVCSTKKMDFVRSLSTDHVIDYTQEDFTKNGQHYDLILDVMAHHSFFDYKHALSPKGIYVMVGGDSSMLNKLLFLGPWISMIEGKKMGLLWHKPNANDLDYIKTLLEDGKITPVIDKRFPLSKVAEAMRYFGERHAKGKVVISVAHNNKL